MAYFNKTQNIKKRPDAALLHTNMLTVLGYTFLMFLSLISTAVEGNFEGFIVGGHEASIKDWPFIAFLLARHGKSTAGACGGTLISSQTVLTAAHCLDDVKKVFGDFFSAVIFFVFMIMIRNNNFSLYNELTFYATPKRIGFTIFMGHNRWTKSKMVRDVLGYRCHGSYDPDDVRYDIGIIILEKPVAFSHTVKKAILMNQAMGDTMIETGDLLVGGWGRTGLHSSGSDYLKSLEQTLLDQDSCLYYINETDLSGVVCGGKLAEMNSTEFAYSGDSGGPLARIRDQTLAGLVSWRMEDHGFTVYTSVPHYYSWIEKTQRALFKQYCSNGEKRDN